MMMKPVIGVMPIYDSYCENVWMLDAYFDGILDAGGIPVMLPITGERDVIGQMAERLDGFLFTGGDDVSPVIYDAADTYSMNTHLPLDQMEVQYIHEILRRDKPF